jgi:hypothetical protein
MVRGAQNTTDGGQTTATTYEAPKLTIIGPISKFTFGSQTKDESDHSLGFTGGHKTV